MEATALQTIPVMTTPVEPLREVMLAGVSNLDAQVLTEVIQDEMHEQIQRSLTAEIERAISVQETPEAFIVQGHLNHQSPNLGEIITADARITVTPHQVPITLRQPSVQITIPPPAPPPPAATVEEAIAGATNHLIGQPLNTQTIEHAREAIAYALMNHAPTQPPQGVAVAQPPEPENEAVYNLNQANNLYAYQATGGITWTNTNLTAGTAGATYQPITVNLGGGAGGGAITYRWVGQDGGAVGGQVLQSQTATDTHWQNHYGTLQNNVYQNIAINTDQYIQWTGGTGGAATYDTATTNYTYTVNTDGNWYVNAFQPETKQQKFKRKVQAQLASSQRKRNALVVVQATPAELKARDTLRDMLSEAEWRRYVTNSFIMVKGASGKFYQIFANHNSERIRVYEKNAHIANLCIHSDSECPPTDHVIAMKIQVELDEDSLWHESNKFMIGPGLGTPPANAGGNVVLNADGTQNVQVNILNGLIQAGYGVQGGIGGNIANPYIQAV